MGIFGSGLSFDDFSFFAMTFAMGSLRVSRLPPTVQRRACEVNWEL